MGSKREEFDGDGEEEDDLELDDFGRIVEEMDLDD